MKSTFINMMLMCNHYMYGKGFIRGIAFCFANIASIIKYFTIKDLSWLWFIYLYVMFIFSKNVNYNLISILSNHSILCLLAILIVIMIDFKLNLRASKYFRAVSSNIDRFIDCESVKYSDRDYIVIGIISFIQIPLFLFIISSFIEFIMIDCVLSHISSMKMLVNNFCDHRNDIHDAVLYLGLFISIISYTVSTYIYSINDKYYS